ncbi:MAG TPA: metal-dependent hydrolase, partial [Polyangiaceae bacterium]|nr:metal-dependent hydrolase [Polyangiaceae bacterium]
LGAALAALAVAVARRRGALGPAADAPDGAEASGANGANGANGAAKKSAGLAGNAGSAGSAGSAAEQSDVRLLWALALFGPVAHVAMDAWNVYGVHPFWPLYDGWFYGDAIFIVEPLLWAAFVPPLLFAARARWWRASLALILGAALALPWALPALVPLPARLGVPALAALALAFSWRAGPGARAAAGLVASAGVVLGFVALGRVVRADLARRLAAEPAPAALLDVALSPLPADPFCWTAVTVQTTAAGELVSRRATLAPFPSLLDAGRCPPAAERTTAPLAPSPLAADAGVRWDGEFRAPLAALRSLARERCDAAAMLRFLRAPFWTLGPNEAVLGDLRFDRSERLDFAETSLGPSGAPCPAFVPPWRPPRRDLLDAAP